MYYEYVCLILHVRASPCFLSTEGNSIGPGGPPVWNTDRTTTDHTQTYECMNSLESTEPVELSAEYFCKKRIQTRYLSPVCYHSTRKVTGSWSQQGVGINSCTNNLLDFPEFAQFTEFLFNFGKTQLRIQRHICQDFWLLHLWMQSEFFHNCYLKGTSKKLKKPIGHRKVQVGIKFRFYDAIGFLGIKLN